MKEKNISFIVILIVAFIVVLASYSTRPTESPTESPAEVTISVIDEDEVEEEVTAIIKELPFIKIEMSVTTFGQPYSSVSVSKSGKINGGRELYRVLEKDQYVTRDLVEIEWEKLTSILSNYNLSEIKKPIYTKKTTPQAIDASGSTVIIEFDNGTKIENYLYNSFNYKCEPENNCQFFDELDRFLDCVNKRSFNLEYLESGYYKHCIWTE